MGYDKIGLGMYTVHQSVEADMQRTFHMLKEFGYEGIEFYGEPVYDKTMVKKALSEAGLQMTGWHIEWRNLQKDKLADTVRYLQQVSCKTAIVPCLGGKWEVAHGPKEECLDVWLRYIEQMNQINETLRREGIRMGYHNHEHEFVLQYDGVKVFDLLFEGLSEDIIMELDSGNCIEGGDDPLRVIEQYKKRDMILHLKPYADKLGFDTVLGAAEDLNPWENILDTDRKQFLWLLVESENKALPECTNAKRCMHGLREILSRL